MAKRTRPEKPVDWTRVGSIAGIVAVVLAVPAAAIGFRELSQGSTPAIVGTTAVPVRIVSSSSSAPAGPLSHSGTLTVGLTVERKDQPDTWSKEVRGIPGDVVTWNARIRNGNDRIRYEHVVARVVLAPHLAVVPGSVRLISTDGDRQEQDAPAFAGGFDVGSFAPGGTLYLLFDTKLTPDFSGCAVRVENIAVVSADGFPSTWVRSTPGSRKSFADVAIGKAHC